MALAVHIALVGDRSDAVVAHRAIPVALDRAAREGGRTVDAEWLHTGSLGPEMAARLADAHGVWCVPGSPYVNMDAALTAIGFARRSGVPFLGTCAGFQHAVIEYARSVLGLTDADHAETNPEAERPLIAALSCGLVEGARPRPPGGGHALARDLWMRRRVRGVSLQLRPRPTASGALRGLVVARERRG